MWSALRQKVNDVEVVQVSGELRQKERACDKQHVRKRDVPEHLRSRSAVHLRGLIEILRDVHQKSCRNQHHVRNADPDIDQDDHDLCERRICPERNRRLDNSCVHQEAVDDAVSVEHLRYIQQRDELRYSDRDDKDGSPEFLELDAFLVDQHGDHETDEVIKEGREECPHERPSENFQECGTETRCAK